MGWSRIARLYVDIRHIIAGQGLKQNTWRSIQTLQYDLGPWADTGQYCTLKRT